MVDKVIKWSETQDASQICANDQWVIWHAAAIKSPEDVLVQFHASTQTLRHLSIDVYTVVVEGGRHM